jgi:AraC-like DNA-binding protein
MSDVIRGTALLHFVDLVAQCGGDGEAFLRARGIDPSALNEFERFLSYSRATAAIGEAAKEFDCPDFGMRLGRMQGIQILGPVAVLIRHSRTVAEAFAGAARYLYVCAPPDIAELKQERHTARFTYSIALRQLAHRNQMIEKSLAVAMEAFRLLLGEDFVPLKVTFQHHRIAPSDNYQQTFGCPVEFGSDENAVHFNVQLLNRPVPGRDSIALSLAENYLASTKPNLALVDHVREAIHRLLTINRASLLVVASAVGLHPRVLQRGLAEAGTSFEDILDDVRCAMAWQLSASGLRVSQISTMLGYSEQSSYARACHRWHGMSPRQLIMQRKNGGDLPKKICAVPQR